MYFSERVTVNVSDCTFSNNVAVRSASLIYSQNQQVMTINASTIYFLKNKVLNSFTYYTGGAFFFDDPTLNLLIDKSSFRNTTARDNSGGLMLISRISKMTMTNCNVTDAYAKD